MLRTRDSCQRYNPALDTPISYPGRVKVPSFHHSDGKMLGCPPRRAIYRTRNVSQVSLQQIDPDSSCLDALLLRLPEQRGGNAA
jgi:hypothetical protein